MSFTIISLGFGSSSAFGSSATGASSFGFGTTSKLSGSLSAGWFVSLEFKFILKQKCYNQTAALGLRKLLKQMWLQLHVYVSIKVTIFLLNAHFQKVLKFC